MPMHPRSFMKAAFGPARLAGRSAVLACVLLAGLVATPAGAESLAPEVAEAPVVQLQDALLESMAAGGERTFEQRRARLETVVRATHHFDVIAVFILGREAQALSRQERSELAERLAHLTAMQYASRFDGGGEIDFERTEVRDYGSRRAIVRTRLVRAQDAPVSLDYVVQRHGGEVGIINVIADGVSEVAIKRVEYGRVFRSDGLAGVLAHIDRQIKELTPA